VKHWISTPNGGGIVSLPLISALDHGFTVGDGIFETLKTEFGKPILLKRHLVRLENSASMLEMEIPDIDTISIAIFEVLAQKEVKDSQLGRLRITVSSGPGELGSARGSGWTLVISWSESSPWPSSCEVVVSEIVRNEKSALAGAKTISYAENVLALKRAKKQGASEAILLNLKGNVCEGTGSNLFIVKNQTVITPPVTDGLLAGITRDAVIEAIPADIRFSELSFDLSELMSADEVFLTSSTRDIQPVVKVDQKEYPVGPITTKLIQEFNEWLKKTNE
jgi:branched-chain amino acid aminotransferase